MNQALAIIYQVCGGLGIFLLGMKNMSEGMQAVAGERLRKLIGAVTNNRLMACGVGTSVVCCRRVRPSPSPCGCAGVPDGADEFRAPRSPDSTIRPAHSRQNPTRTRIYTVRKFIFSFT